MSWDRLRGLLAAALVGGFLGLAGGLSWPCPQPKAIYSEPVEWKLRDYNVILADGTKTAWKGTHITSSGFCTQIWVGRVLDTNICIAHVITEALEVEESSGVLEEENGRAS